MYLVGLVTQAAVLGALVAGALYYEEPIRDRLGLAPPQTAELTRSVEEMDARVAALSATVERIVQSLAATEATRADIAEQVDDFEETLAGTTTTGERNLAQRLAVVESLAARIEGKLDDVRDAQLFPSRQAVAEQDP